jgi:hypothetical protein
MKGELLVGDRRISRNTIFFASIASRYPLSLVGMDSSHLYS